MKRMNITVSDEIAELLKNKPNKSRFIAEAVREKMIREKREQLISTLIEGYNSEKAEGRRVNVEWEAGTLDSWE